MVELTSEQEQVFNYLQQGYNVLCEAVPGAGKTTVALVAAKNLGVRTLVCCYNKSLAAETNIVLGNNPLIDAFTFHGLAGRLTNKTVCEDGLLEKAVAELWHHRETLPKLDYKFIVLDEAQDMSPRLAALIQCVLALCAEPPQLLVIGDRWQCLYDDALHGASFIFLTEAPRFFSSTRPWQTCNLTLSQRLTPAIARMVTQLAVHNCPAKALRSNRPDGPLPQIIKYNQRDFSEVLQILRALDDPGDAAVLGATWFEVEQAAKAAGQHGLNVVLKDTGTAAFLAHKIFFGTYHSAKGMTRRTIIVLANDANAVKFHRPPLDNALYVALTRAAHQLVLALPTSHHRQCIYPRAIRAVPPSIFRGLVQGVVEGWALFDVTQFTPPPLPDPPATDVRQIAAQLGETRCAALLQAHDCTPRTEVCCEMEDPWEFGRECEVAARVTREHSAAFWPLALAAVRERADRHEIRMRGGVLAQLQALKASPILSHCRAAAQHNNSPKRKCLARSYVCRPSPADVDWVASANLHNHTELARALILLHGLLRMELFRYNQLVDAYTAALPEEGLATGAQRLRCMVRLSQVHVGWRAAGLRGEADGLEMDTEVPVIVLTQTNATTAVDVVAAALLAHLARAPHTIIANVAAGCRTTVPVNTALVQATEQYLAETERVSHNVASLQEKVRIVREAPPPPSPPPSPPKRCVTLSQVLNGRRAMKKNNAVLVADEEPLAKRKRF